MSWLLRDFELVFDLWSLRVRLYTGAAVRIPATLLNRGAESFRSSLEKKIIVRQGAKRALRGVCLEEPSLPRNCKSHLGRSNFWAPSRVKLKGKESGFYPFPIATTNVLEEGA